MPLQGREQSREDLGVGMHSLSHFWRVLRRTAASEIPLEKNHVYVLDGRVLAERIPGAWPGIKQRSYVSPA
jgi:hypothetical protein